jgi:mono/diheme cytochrome c family protein
MKRCLIASLLVALLAGCGSPRRDEPLVGELAPASDLVRRGEQVFAAKCHQCHPNGAAGLAPAINDKPVPQWLLKTQVRVGLGAMPGFSSHEISASDREALAKYVKALRRNQ